MLSIQSSNPQKCTPNLLPARINHNGPINDAHRYWKPETDNKGKQHAFFRGRHLHGTTLELPTGYTGAVVNTTEKQLPQAKSQEQSRESSMGEDGEEDEEDSAPAPVYIAEQIGEFDKVVVWGHGGEVDGGSDMLIRGMTEWIGFAESMHVEEEDKTQKDA